MKAIITTFDDKAVTLTLAAVGAMDEAEKERLNDLFRSSGLSLAFRRKATTC